MTTMRFANEILEELRQKYPRFHPKAYLFVLSALRFILDDLDEPRHISGAELSEGVRELALERFGPMARTVLEHWGIHATDDVGEIVFALVDCGILTKEDEDSPEDFRAVFDFEDAFEDYPWGANL